MKNKVPVRKRGESAEAYMKRLKPVKLTKAQMRVAVAKDALKQLATERYIARNMIFASTGFETSGLQPNEQIQPLLRTHEEPCKVCARGALWLSSIRKFNHCTVNEFDNASEESSERLFGVVNLRRMEAAFELWENTAQLDTRKERAFGLKYDNAHDRLVAILKNVIKNKGQFKP